MISSGSLKVALEYADSGLPVFPLRPHSKEPFAGTRGLKDATTDRGEIIQMWSGWETANIGIAIPSDVIVVDCDSREAARQVEAVYGLGGTVEVRTPRGHHYWFKWPKSEGRSRSTTNLFRVGDDLPLKKVDTRGYGGYVVAPPSRVGKGQYEWVVGDAEGWRDDILSAPQWLIDCFSEGHKGEGETSLRPKVSLDLQVSEGGRNDALFRRACEFRRDDLPLEVAKAALLLINQESCIPPLPTYEVAKILKSAWEYEPSTSKYSSVLMRKERPKGVFKRLSSAKQRSYEWLLQPYIAMGQPTLLAGPGGLGKSMACCALAAHVTTGLEIQGVGPVPEGPVCFFSGEDDESVLSKRVQANGGDLDKCFFYSLPPGGLVFDSETLTDIAEGIAEIKPKLVIVDPLMKFIDTDTDVFRGNDVDNLIRGLGSLSHEYGCAMVLVHHTAASGKVYGSVYFVNAVRSVLKLYADPVEPRYRYLAHHKSNHSELAASIRYTVRGDMVLFDGTHDRWTDLELASYMYDPAHESVIADVMDEISARKNGGRISPGQLRSITNDLLVRREITKLAMMRLGLKRVHDGDTLYYE